MVKLNDNEAFRHDTILSLINKNITRKEASKTLNITLRQVDRLVNKYKLEGDSAFIHKNKNKISLKKMPKELIKELESLYLKEYYDYNFEAFYEEVKKKNYQISYNSIFQYFIRDDIISPLAHKKTVKLYNNHMKKAIESKEDDISEEKIELYNNRIITLELAHIRKSNNLFYFGQEVQMDACFKAWFGDIVSALHLAVDKGTKKVLFGWFEYEEITRGYFVVLYHIIINYGIPKKIKTDNRSTFSTNRKDNKLQITQFEAICNVLDIELETSSIATAKANVERENNTFKNRLISELRHENITDIDSANKYLNEEFIPKMNSLFSYQIDEKKSQMRKNNYTLEELNLIISEKYNKTIDNAGAIKYKCNYYVPINSETGEIICFKYKTSCTLIIAYDATLWIKVDDKYYCLIKLENRDSIMKKEIPKESIKAEKERKKYIPPTDHPWRKSYKKIKRKKE